ncbi:MAG: hypothetical protein JW982_07165 [Spirochaetes bacterium]|nr:hypothetical protein [Spirochaetota bacterium]
MKKSCTIISANGEKTFTDLQIDKINKKFDAVFIKNLSPLNDDEFIKLTENSEFIAVTRRASKDINENILSKLKKLKGIAAYSTGYEWIDTDYCRSNGIEFKYLKKYSTDTVAEHTLGMLLSISRRIHLSNDKSRNMTERGVSLRGFELRNKKIGILGFGEIGKRFSEIIIPITENIRFHDIRPEAGSKRKHKIKSVGFDELLSWADVMVILADKKRGEKPIIGYEEMKKMKPGAVIINSARASLVDNDAVIRGITEKKISGYAVDDKIDIFNDPEIEHGRILQTHHTGWYSDEAIRKGTDEWVKNILSFN